MNLFQVFHSGDFVLIATFLTLIAMSIYNWYLAIIKFFQLKAEQSDLEIFLSNKDIDFTDDIAVRIKQNIDDFLLKKSEVNLSVLNKKLDNHIDDYFKDLSSKLNFFASSASSAPFIGLFGTVWGIYRALTEIAKNGNASLDVVAGPVGEALVATAIGLFVAIPASVFYNYFMSKAEFLADKKKKYIENNIFKKTLES